MKPYQLCGLGNAIVDIFLELSDAEFAELGFARGGMVLVDAPEQKQLLEKFHAHDPRLVSGGSLANSAIAFSQLGGKAAFIGCVGDDRYGLHYEREFSHLGIDIGTPVIVGETTGTCVCVITPDAERTMRTCLAVSSHLSAKHVDEDRIKNSDWLFVEGYVFANPETGQGAIRRALELAKKHGTKVAITCSDAFVVEVFGGPLFDALKQADLLFCNATEARAATKTASVTEAFAALKSLVPNAVVTDGPHGAHVRFGGTEVHVPSVACEPKDLTGAGDMFAGSFLYGITHGFPPAVAARGACHLSSKVISQIGARLHQGARETWDHAVA
ncbi:adenosine kinase [Fimbriiglobus ruber]|uniref:Ribokinase n=1 Tax=Fimbriiglobus ruber TaxID=1908690 RepID=A0A225DGT7_9BACT|nr:adenosine kinase [Fimbriiglobus ruber]OWK38894.1 Ribokinase [Fimbriiglobus ruber]OWK44946.1 Ribokinase [Fimbriiglobus ruber]